MKLNSATRSVPITLVVVLFLGQPAISYAYVGPGAGLSIIGSLLAFLAAIVIGIFGFIWFPIRRLLRKRKLVAEQIRDEPEGTSEGPANRADGDKVERDESEG